MSENVYIEPNRHDPYECDACFAIEDLCDYHLGVSVGMKEACDLFQFAAENLDGVYLMRRQQKMGRYGHA